MKAIIFLTGKPGTGKDTLAIALNDYMRSPHLKLGDPLMNIMKIMFNIDDEYIEEINKDRKLKELPSDVFHGKSYRECMIWMAEECIKPKFGKDFFIKNLINRIENTKFKDIFLVSDLGFKNDELSHIDGEKYKTYIIKIKRNDIDSSVVDSREDIDENLFATIDNDGSIENFIAKGKDIFMKIYRDLGEINNPRISRRGSKV